MAHTLAHALAHGLRVTPARISPESIDSGDQKFAGVRGGSRGSLPSIEAIMEYQDF
jgi:hypothetical protein